MNDTKRPDIAGEIWFNSKPLSPEDLAGKAVLADFWTYTCVNCQRTLPYLRDWWSKYKDKDFVIIGIHTPEFEFEKEPKNVEQAIKDLGVEWPVVLDNDYVNWRNFANHYWPAKYLSDKQGNIVYTHFGEGAYAETEKAIQKLIGGEGEIDSEEHAHGNVCFAPTPETYCGYARGHIENNEGYQHDALAHYQKPEKMARDSIALSGKFLVRSEYVESAEQGAELLLNFHATEVNLVLHPVGKDATIETYLDGKSLGQVHIKKPALYNFLKSSGLVQGMLSIRAKQGNFRAYAFTFSGCENT